MLTTLLSLSSLTTTLTVHHYINNVADSVKRDNNINSYDSMSSKQWKVTVTLNKELYEQLQARADKEARTLAGLGKYLLLKGLEAEQRETADK